jgi:hypothetical protein
MLTIAWWVARSTSALFDGNAEDDGKQAFHTPPAEIDPAYM